MTTTISEVEGWRLSELEQTAADLKSGSKRLNDGATQILNSVTGVRNHWHGEAATAGLVRAMDHYGILGERAKCWDAAATILEKAAQQLGLAAKRSASFSIGHIEWAGKVRARPSRRV
ncbi:hypothetical protein GOARA_068_00570 [Gordonia araii NBRC 100433]|uniref:Uncharacterized protein n=1 Tax=Gordonia araii NBRC 100433 TaxID=1073574 RepID=G7H6C3_9ACTN|nr:hypothetical protein GOARA_068_00570 [Gordonia araii NBRC 100433]